MSAPIVGEDGVARCPWAGPAGTMRDYHDTEWGLPVAGEDALFERMALEGFQAGLSWRTILDKRERFREVFAGFRVDRVAAMTDAELDALMDDTGIVRNRAKIQATRRNARASVELRAEGGLVAFVESFAPAVTPAPERTRDLPTTSAESLALSKALKKKGFGFVGPTTVYALFEAVGYVDTHLTGCFRRGCSGRW